MGRLTTHVLDTAQGCPAHGIPVSLFRITATRELINEAVTNADGRLDAPILENDSFVPGTYELIFSVGEYFRQSQADLPEPSFVDDVVLRFGIANGDQHYHVPLLVSPWSYSTYRGS
eukprot:UN33559